jgi:hypothetical protein
MAQECSDRSNWEVRHACSSASHPRSHQILVDKHIAGVAGTDRVWADPFRTRRSSFATRLLYDCICGQTLDSWYYGAILMEPWWARALPLDSHSTTPDGISTELEKLTVSNRHSLFKFQPTLRGPVNTFRNLNVAVLSSLRWIRYFRMRLSQGRWLFATDYRRSMTRPCGNDQVPLAVRCEPGGRFGG